MLTPATLHTLKSTLGQGGLISAQSNDSRAALSRAVLSGLSNPNVSGGIKSTLLYRPLADTLTLGLYSYIAGGSAVADIVDTVALSPTPI